MPPVLGLIGKKRSGKDTFAAELVTAHGFRRLAFADALKKAALGADPIVTFDEVEGGDYGYGGEWFPRTEFAPVRLSETVAGLGWEKAKELPEVRRLLQHFGVGLREIDADIWLRPIRDAIQDRTSPVVVTDVRFANEAEMLLRMGGRLVRIERPGVDDGDTHESESALPWIAPSLTIQNDRTVAHLMTFVPTVLDLFER